MSSYSTVSIENNSLLIDSTRIDDVIVGNATPEAEQGLNIGRMVSLIGLNTDLVPGMTVNRYCSSGLESIAIASAKINAGMAHCIIAGGVETRSPIPFGGWRVVPNAKVAANHPSWYWGMGNTAEEVANRFSISRAEQDEFAFNSHQKALKAIDAKLFKDEIVPIEVEEIFLDEHAPRSFVKLASLVTSLSSTPSLSTIIAFTLDATSDSLLLIFYKHRFF